MSTVHLVSALFAVMIFLGTSGALPAGPHPQSHGGEVVENASETAAKTDKHRLMQTPSKRSHPPLNNVDEDFFDEIAKNKRISDVDYMEFLLGKMKRTEEDFERRDQKSGDPQYWDFVLGDSKRSP